MADGAMRGWCRLRGLRVGTTLCAALAAWILGGSAPSVAAEPALSTAWVSEHATRARLVAGGVLPGAAAGGVRLLAGIEIELDEGWKTYWRNPGSSGVPPRLEWTGSENLAAAEALFPAPERFKERDGDTIGYKRHVVLPVAVEPRDPAKPVVLQLALEYGVCREVCVPAQATLKLTLPPGGAAPAPGSGLAAAVERVPRAHAARRDGDPRLDAVAIVLAGDKPHITVEGTWGAAKGADVFMEAPDGLWLPLATMASDGREGKRRFHVDLTDGSDLAALKGREIRLTLVGDAGASEATFKLE